MRMEVGQTNEWHAGRIGTPTNLEDLVSVLCEQTERKKIIYKLHNRYVVVEVGRIPIHVNGVNGGCGLFTSMEIPVSGWSRFLGRS
jgi:hypothetical protein